jgi:hypothetical protein
MILSKLDFALAQVSLRLRPFAALVFAFDPVHPSATNKKQRG